MSNVVQEIDENLALLRETKANIRDAIEGKGVSVSDTDSFGVYADKIQQIEGNPGQYLVNMRLSNGISDSEIVNGHKVIAVKTGEIPTEAGTLTKITDFRFTGNPNNDVRYWHFKNAKYALYFAQSGLAFVEQDGNFVATDVFDDNLSATSYFTMDTELPLLFSTSSTYNYSCTGLYQDKEGNFDTISFDVEPDVPEGITSYLCVHCSHDGKYLYAWRTSKSSVSVNPKLYIYSVSFTNKLEATLITSCEIPASYCIRYVCPSCNDYSVACKSYSGDYPTILVFDEETQTLSLKSTLTNIGTGYHVQILSKDWCVSNRGFLYHLGSEKEITKALSGTITDWSQPVIPFVNSIDDMFLSFASAGTARLIRCPIDIAEPELADFGYCQAKGTSGRWSGFFLSRSEFMLIWDNYYLTAWNYFTSEEINIPFVASSGPLLVSDEGVIACYQFSGENNKVVAPVNGIYDGSIMESSSIVGTSFYLLPKQTTPMRNGEVDVSMGYSVMGFSALAGVNSVYVTTNQSSATSKCFVFEDRVFQQNYCFVLNKDNTATAINVLSSADGGYCDFFYYNDAYYAITRSSGLIRKITFDADTPTIDTMTTDSSLITNKNSRVGGITKDNRYIFGFDYDYYYEISDGSDGNPIITKRTLPPAITDNCPASLVRGTQFFYDNHFGVGLTDGFYYLFKYTDSLEDVELVKVIPPKFSGFTDYTFAYTAHRHYWLVMASIGSYNISCFGKEQTEPIGVDWTAFKNTDAYYNKGIITGFLTGEKVSDDGQGNRVVKVRAILE